MPSDSEPAGTPQHWLARAKGHLAMARVPKPDSGFWEDLAFHAQRAAEFALKAVYQHRGLVYRFTHNLAELGTGLENAGLSLPTSVADAVILTRYAVRARYPGTSPAVTQEEHAEAIRLAEEVVAWARTQILGADAPD